MVSRETQSRWDMEDKLAAWDKQAKTTSNVVNMAPAKPEPEPFPELTPLQAKQLNGVMARLKAKRTQKPWDQRGEITFLDEPKPYLHAPELIRDTLPLTGIAFLAGQSGAGKTFLNIELATCLMTGKPFAGREIEQSGGVLYVAFEGAGTIEGRLMARRTQLDDPTASLPFAILEGFGAILTPDDYEAFGQKLAKLNSDMQARYGVPLRAVFIDTVAAAGMIKPDSENDPGSWQAVFDGLNPISKALRALIVLTHHLGKSADAGLRGSSNARAGADAVLAMTCTRDEVTGDSTNHNLALTKSRTAKEGSIAQVGFESVQIGERPDGSPVTTLVLKFDTGTIVKSMSRHRKPSKGRLALVNALENALADQGQQIRVQGQLNSPMIKAVNYDCLVMAFERFYLSGHSEGDPKRHNAIRMALRRAIDASPDVSIGRWDATDWVWLPYGWKGQE